VHLAVASEWSQKPIYDVIAVMKGSQYPNQWVLRGNHHDGWVFGAFDPLAGNIAVMAEAKAIGELAKAGWAPRRTLVYASWDGEEPGLLGSTEWAETHDEELRRKAVLYVNSDTNARGFLFIGGSHAYQHFANEVAGGVPDPETGASILSRLRAKVMVDAMDGGRQGDDPDARMMLKAAQSGGDLPLEALGSGSDYSPFLQHVGVSCINLGFAGEGENSGIYHSAYDSFDHFVRFGDPKFEYGVALARTAGRLVLRAADADVIPQRFGDLADTAAEYVSQVEKLAETERANAKALGDLIGSGAYALAADPENAVKAPEAPGAVPTIDFGALERAAARLRRSAKAYDDAFVRASAGDFAIPSGDMVQLNQLLQGMEQALTSPRGLPGRDWYRHMLYAPGASTGYAAKTLPAVREAIESRRWEDAAAYIPVAASCLEALAARIDQAAGLLAARASAPPRGKAIPPPADN
jgi:N-acetylated-alpha-linked acidic dipeptidase